MDVLVVGLALSVVAPTDFQEIDNSTEALWELVHDLREEVQELKNQRTNHISPFLFVDFSINPSKFFNLMIMF